MIDECLVSTDDAARLKLVDALCRKGKALIGLQAYEDALVSLDLALERCAEAEDEDLREQAATALGRKASALARLGRVAEVEAVSDQLLDRFGDGDELSVRQAVVHGLLCRCESLRAAKRSGDVVGHAADLLRRAADLPPGEVNYAALGRRLMMTSLDLAGEPQRVLEACDEIIDLHRDDGDAAARLTVALAFETRAGAMVKLDRLEAAVDARAQFVASYGDAIEPSVRALAAVALVRQAGVLRRLGRVDQALAVLDDLFVRFSDDPPVGWSSLEADAWSARAALFAAAGREHDAAAAYDQVAAGGIDSGDPSRLARAANALLRKVDMLREAGPPERALEGVEEALQRAAGIRQADAREQLLSALLWKQARILDRLGRRGEALEVWTEVSQRAGAEHAPAGSALGAIALAGQAKDLRAVGRYDEAIAACDQLMDRYGADDRREVREALCGALWAKVRAAAAQDREGVINETVDELLARFADSTDPNVWSEVTKALVFKVMASFNEHRSDLALTFSDRLVRQFQQRTDPPVLAAYGVQLLNTAAAFRALALRGPRQGSARRPVSERRARGWRLLLLHLRAAQRGPRAQRRPLLAEALRIDQLLIDRLGETTDPKTRLLVVEAQLQVLPTLAALGRFRDASKLVDELAAGGPAVIDALQTISDREVDNAGTGARVRIANTLMLRAYAVTKLGDRAQTQAALDEMAERFRADTSLRVRVILWLSRNVIANPQPPWRIKRPRR